MVAALHIEYVMKYGLIKSVTILAFLIHDYCMFVKQNLGICEAACRRGHDVKACEVIQPASSIGFDVMCSAIYQVIRGDIRVRNLQNDLRITAAGWKLPEGLLRGSMMGGYETRRT